MSSSSIIWKLRESPNLFSNTWLRPAADNSGAPKSPQYSTDTQSYLQYYSQYFNSKCCTHLSSTQFSSLGPRHSASVWSQVCQVGSRLISYKFTTHLTFSSGLTYVTVLVRSNEGQSSWFCYLICLQLLVNWVQFLLHRSDPKVYKVLTFNSIYFNRSFVPLSNDNYPGYVHMWVEWWYMIQGA